MKFDRKSLLSLGLLTFLTVGAQNPIDGIIDTIVNNNPELKSQSQLIQAQQADDIDANSLSNPEVELSRVWGRHGIGNKLQLDISQEFEWPGVYRVRRMAAQQGVNSAEMELESAKLDLALEAKNLLVDLVCLRNQINLLTELRDDLRELQKVVDVSAEKQLVSVLDQRKMQMELYQLDVQISQYESEAQGIEASLQAMCACQLDLSGVNAYPIEKVLTREQYAAQIQELDPMLSAQKFAAAQEELNAKTATQSRFPTFSVGYQHQAEMGDRFNGFTLGMSLPFFQNRKAKAAALSRKSAAELSEQTLVTQKLAELDSQLASMAIWKKQIDGYYKTFGAQKYLQLLKMAYDGGEMSIIEYINEIHYYHDIVLSNIENEYNYQKALTNLNKYSLLR